MFTADLLERMVKTFVQTFIATFGLVFAAPADVTNAGGWKAAAIAAVLASVSAAVSAVTSILSKPYGAAGTASVVPVPAPVAPAPVAPKIKQQDAAVPAAAPVPYPSA